MAECNELRMMAGHARPMLRIYDYTSVLEQLHCELSPRLRVRRLSSWSVDHDRDLT